MFNVRKERPKRLIGVYATIQMALRCSFRIFKTILMSQNSLCADAMLRNYQLIRDYKTLNMWSYNQSTILYLYTKKQNN